METLKPELTKARAGLLLQSPFYAGLVYSMKHRPDPSAKTGWTDGKVIAYNPDFLKTLDLDEKKTFFAHEGLHPGLKHHLRRNGRDYETYQKACDYVINSILKKAGFKMPTGALYSPRFDGLNLDQIFNVLWGEKLAQQAQEKAQQQQQESAGQGNEKPDTQTPPPAPMDPDPGNLGEVRDYTGADAAEEETNATIRLQNALTLGGKKAGQIPAELVRLIKEIISPALPWEEILSRFIDQNAKTNFSYRKPNKRYLAYNLYLPSLDNPELGKVYLFQDTSGSMDEDRISRNIKHTLDLLNTYPDTKLFIFWIDHAFHGDPDGNPLEIEPGNPPAEFKPIGGGGTSFRPGFHWMEDHPDEDPPACIIYFTDGECSSFPHQEPEAPVLWVIQPDGEKDFNPPFGETIHMRPED